MIRLNYDLSLSNENFRENRVDELDNFMKQFYPDKYKEINKIYKRLNPIFGILTFLSIPFVAFSLYWNMWAGVVATIISVFGLFGLTIYMDQKPKQIKKDIFTDIHEKRKYIVTDIEYKLLSQPVIYNNKEYYYYEFIKSLTDNYRINVDKKIENASIDTNREPASYESITNYLDKFIGGHKYE